MPRFARLVDMNKKIITIGSSVVLLALAGCGANYEATVPKGLPGSKQVVVIEASGSLDQNDFYKACGDHPGDNVALSGDKNVKVSNGATTPGGPIKVTRLPDYRDDLSAVVVSCR